MDSKNQNRLNINNRSSLFYDNCVNDFKNTSNDRIFNHSFDPTLMQIKPENSRNQYINNSNILGTMETNNVDNKGQYVNIGTSLRNGIMTHDGHRNQLDTRLFPGAPFLAQGQSVLKNPDLSSKLMQAQHTRSNKSQGSMVDISIDNFVPLIPCIKDNVQNTDHIIPEYWVRGGMSTRSVIRNIDYLKSCGNKNN
jgi:hypothetical protein